MAQTSSCYTYEQIKVPDSLLQSYWNSNSPAGLSKIDSELKGNEDHSKLMLVLQKYLYEESLNLEGIEKRHHDLVDTDRRLMAEVGTNGLASNELKDFLVRVFRLHYNMKNTENVTDWDHFYLNYDLDMYRVRVTGKGQDVLKHEIEQLKKGIMESMKNVDF